MGMKKILLYSRDPGAANCIIPVYKKIKKTKRYRVELFGKDFALDLYKANQCTYVDIKKIIPQINLSAIKHFLRNGNYDLVLTGNTGNDFTDRILWDAAKQLRILTIAIVDNWQNYTNRFSYELPQVRKKSRVEILPDRICIMDNYARKEMVDEGFPSHKLVVTGQPYLEVVLRRQKKITRKEKITFSKQLGIKKDNYLITFASEPIIETWCNIVGLGYTQITIFKAVMAILLKIAKECKTRNFTVLIKLHPSEKNSIFNETVASYYPLPDNIKIIIQKIISLRLIIAVSDLIIGMSSMFLIEAALAGKPYLSVQIGLKTKDPFVLSRSGVSKSILSSRELFRMIKMYINGHAPRIKKPLFIRNASDNIIKLINSLLYA